MKSTGEVMGVGRDFPEAFGKAMLASSVEVPRSGRAFLSVRERDHQGAVVLARELQALGFSICATEGTHKAITAGGLNAERVNKLQQGRPNIVDRIINGEIDLIVNTTEGRKAVADSRYIREEALKRKVAYTTTLTGAKATCHAIRQSATVADVYALHEIHQEIA